MKLFLSHLSAACWLPSMVIALSLLGAAPVRAQSRLDVGSIQESGDEMSRQVGGFFRKLFYGQDRNSNPYQQPQYQQRQYQQAPQPYPAAPQRQSGYQYAPPPAGGSQRSTPPQQHQQQAPVALSRRAPSRIAEPEKPKRKEVPPSKASSNAGKRPAVQSTPPKHTDEPSGKQVSKRKTYTPPTIAGDDSSESKPKKTPKSEPPAPVRKESNVAKNSHQDEPPAHKFEPSETKSTPLTPKDEPGGLSPYADGYAGGTTVMAPKDKPPSKPQTEEPKKEAKLNTPPAPTDGAFPTGTRSKTNPGSVVSPYPPHNELDVSGLPSGSFAIDPTTKKVFKVP